MNGNRESGQTTAFVVIITVTLVLCAGLVFDGGRVVSARIRLMGIADEAARAGAQQLDLEVYRRTGHVRLDSSRAGLAARRFLAASSVSGTVAVSGDRVHVMAVAPVPMRLLSVAGLGQLSVHATGDAHPVRGIDQPEQ